MNYLGGVPWRLTFSYGRALQDPSLTAWRGDSAMVDTARQALYKRARCNSAACTAGYSITMEAEVA